MQRHSIQIALLALFFALNATSGAAAPAPDSGSASGKSAADLTKSAETLVARDKEKKSYSPDSEPNGITKCNLFLQDFYKELFAVTSLPSELTGQANEVFDALVADSAKATDAKWKRFDIPAKHEEAQKLFEEIAGYAKNGDLVIVVVKIPDHGHVAVVMPKDVRDSSWKVENKATKVPVVAQAGNPMTKAMESKGCGTDGVYAYADIRMSCGFPSSPAPTFFRLLKKP